MDFDPPVRGFQVQDVVAAALLSAVRGSREGIGSLVIKAIAGLSGRAALEEVRGLLVRVDDANFRSMIAMLPEAS
jgi:hypothetical protein